MDLQDPDVLIRLNRATTLAAVGQGLLHHLRNPLQGITMAARTISDSPQDSAMVARLAPVVLAASEKLSIALDHFGLVHSIEANAPPQPTALQAVIPPIVATYRDLPKRNAPSIIMDLAPDLPAVFAVEPHLRQVLLNLVLNAGEALEQQQQPTIHILVQQRGDRVLISVEDNGPGISVVELDKVFAPYFTTKGESGHLGLGLTVSAHLVATSGGSLHVENKEPEGGMRATLSLRVARG